MQASAAERETHARRGWGKGRERREDGELGSGGFRKRQPHSRDSHEIEDNSRRGNDNTRGPVFCCRASMPSIPVTSATCNRRLRSCAIISRAVLDDHFAVSKFFGFNVVNAPREMVERERGGERKKEREEERAM